MRERKLKQMRTAAAALAALFFLSMIFAMTPIQVAASPESEVIVTTGNVTDYTWSSDGTRIAFVKCPDGQLWGELWVGDWDGYGVTNLQLLYSEIDEGGLEDWQGDWILIRIRHENDLPGAFYGRGELWKIKDDGAGLTQITFTYTNGIRTEWWNAAYTNIGTAGYGRFTPGTDLVYFTAHDGNGWWKAYTCNADGTDQWNLISGSTFSFTIGMSPTGNKFVWGTASYWNNPTTLLSSNIDGTGMITMKAFPYKTYPLVLADGDTVVHSIPGGNIGAIQVDGTNDRVVIDDEYANYWVNYNPVDGQSFLMVSNRAPDGNAHIFGIDVEGTGIVQLTEGPYNDDSAMYSPDGYRLLYRRLPIDSDGPSYELVIAMNDAPVAHAGGPYTADEGVQITFDASGSTDIEGNQLQFRWDFDNDGSWDTVWSINPMAIHTWNDDYSGVVEVEVTDGELSDTDTATVTVNNVAPSVNAGGDQAVNEGQIVSLSPAITDPGTDTFTYSWNFGDGSPISHLPSHQYGDNGLYTVTLTVEDDDGGVGTDTLTVTVDNVAPTADAGPDQTANEGDTVSFMGAFYDPGWLDTHTIVWDFGDGSPTVTGTVTPTHEYGDNGVYIVTLTVTDDDGNVGSDTLTVTVDNVAPILTISGNAEVDEGSMYTLHLASDDPGDDCISEWVINWGDGNIITYPGNPDFVTHTYADGPNVYSIGATATDEDGTYVCIIPSFDLGFETGDFTDWALSIPYGGSAQVVISHMGDSGTLYSPKVGTYFALLKTDGAGSYTSMKKIVYLYGGQTISGWAAFDARDYSPFNDNAMVRILDSFGYVIATPWYADVYTVGDYGDGPWTPWSWIAPSVGTFTIEYRVANALDSEVDSYALFDAEIASFSVSVNNLAPSVDGGPHQTVNEGCTVSFTGAFYDPGSVDTHTIVWDFGDGSLAVTGTLTPNHEYGDNGVYIVTLTVTDDDGGVGSDTLSVTVNNVAPTVDAGIDQTVNEGDTVSLMGDFYDPGWLDTHTIVWDFGDGSPAFTGTLSTSYVYELPGVYIVTLTVTDDDGGIGTDSLLVAVLDTTPPTTTLLFLGLYYISDHTYISSTATEILLVAEDAEMPYGSGVDVIQYQIDSTHPDEWVTYTAPFAVDIIGTHIVYYRSIDKAGNVETEKWVEVVVNASELTYTGQVNGVYSDPAYLEARLIDIATQLPIGGKTIHFQVGGRTATAITHPDGIANVTIVLSQPSGTYQVKAWFDSDGEYLASSSQTHDFTIEKEAACVEYTGSTVVPTTVATITLRATVFDDADGYLGDLTKVWVTFRIYTVSSGSLGLYQTHGPYQVEVTSVEGVGVFEVEIPNLPDNGYVVIISLDSDANDYYKSDPSEMVVITVYEPTGNFVTGGGWIWDSEGYKGNFGFNVKYKNDGLPKGQFIYVYRDGHYEFIVKSTAWLGMAIVDNHSFFEAKCVVQQYDSRTGELIWSEGNYRFRVDVWDNDDTEGVDVLQIRVYDKIGLVYHEAGIEPYGFLQGGNIVIHINKKE